MWIPKRLHSITRKQVLVTVVCGGQKEPWLWISRKRTLYNLCYLAPDRLSRETLFDGEHVYNL